MVYVIGPFGMVFPVTQQSALFAVAGVLFVLAVFLTWRFVRIGLQEFGTQPGPAPEPMPTPEPHPGYPVASEPIEFARAAWQRGEYVDLPNGGLRWRNF